MPVNRKSLRQDKACFYIAQIVRSIKIRRNSGIRGKIVIEYDRLQRRFQQNDTGNFTIRSHPSELRQYHRRKLFRRGIFNTVGHFIQPGNVLCRIKPEQRLPVFFQQRLF